uniref:MarR family winged helix-turn-helix transcriptional regulator n=1 Tax=Paractinoplanes polyasparticus TaxID=2856853 RepID=UPI001C84FBF3|nr:MarR family transcriptional regulator [Actinoplanes polyasparticus]
MQSRFSSEQTTNDTLSADEEAFLENLLNAAVTIQRNIKADFSDEPGGNLMEFNVLRRLARAQGYRMRINELAVATNISISWMSRTVLKLVRRNLVRREPVSDDRRGWYAIATDSGLEWLRSAEQSYASSVRRHTTSLLDPDTVQTVTAATRLLAGGGPDPARSRAWLHL